MGIYRLPPQPHIGGRQPLEKRKLPPSQMLSSVMLSVADVTHSHALDNVVLTQKHVLAVSDLVHGHLLDNVVLTQKHVLAVSDLVHGHSLDGIVLIYGENPPIKLAIRSIMPNILAMWQPREPTEIEQSFILPPEGPVVLAVSNLVHGHALDNVTLMQKHQLTVNDLLHGHTLDAVVLTQKQVLAINNLLHGHTLDSVALTQKHLLVVNDLFHGHTIDNIKLNPIWVSLDGIIFFLN